MNIKKILSITLITITLLIAVVSLCACGKNKKIDVVGKWTCVSGMTSITLTFEDNGKYTKKTVTYYLNDSDTETEYGTYTVEKGTVTCVSSKTTTAYAYTDGKLVSGKDTFTKK